MTTQRRDNHSTEFGIWLRKQSEIDSKLGFVATNIDYLWRNYKTQDWMFIEEKRFGKTPQYPQTAMFDLVDKVARNDPMYKGFHFLTFEKTSPEDGAIILDGSQITSNDLIDFLRFRKLLHGKPIK